MNEANSRRSEPLAAASARPDVFSYSPCPLGEEFVFGYVYISTDIDVDVDIDRQIR